MNNLQNICEIDIVYKSKVKPADRQKLTTSKDAFNVFNAISQANGKIEHKEIMYVLLLNRNNKILGVSLISEGGTSGTICDAKIVFQIALKANASAFILCHNHPSGNVNPSQTDIQLTKKIKELGKMMEIQLLDHIIITPDETYTSMTDEGII